MRIVPPNTSVSLGASSSHASAEAAAVAAIEARFEREARQARAEQRAKRFSSFCAVCLILFIVAGTVWYFAGEKFLPEEYAYEKVSQHFPAPLKKLLGIEPPPPPPAPIQVDPRDAATAQDRKMIAKELDLLEEVCASQPPIQNGTGMEAKIAASKVRRFYEIVLREDGAYAKTLQREEYMRQRNEKLDRQRVAEMVAPNRRYANQYSAKDFAAVELTKDKNRTACMKARQRAVESFRTALTTWTAKWTGPDSKRDLKSFNKRLESLCPNGSR